MDYAKMYDRCKIVSADGDVEHVVDMINRNDSQYAQVAQALGIPWFLVGSIHFRESSLNFSTYLGNGQPLNKVTTIVPKGRGPFSSWYEGAIDALSGFHMDHVWDVTDVLQFAEAYNGMGYAKHGLPSPYVWACTDQYKGGLYTSDGHLDLVKVDHRPGVAAILKQGRFL